MRQKLIIYVFEIPLQHRQEQLELLSQLSLFSLEQLVPFAWPIQKQEVPWAEP